MAMRFRRETYQMGLIKSACIRLSILAALAVTWLGGFSASAAERRPTDKPNIIYIMADDMGYGDLGCYGSTLNATPHIDKLAGGGMRFTDFHAASWCAPSRKGLMTGCHPNRPGFKGKKLADAITMAEMLKANGYATALIGKWHLGMGKGTHPLDQGFDYWYGTIGSNDWNGPRPNYDSFKNAPEKAWKTPLHINRENKGPIVLQSEFTGQYTKQTVRLIKENKDKPFFIYLAHNMPHVPIFASKPFQGKSKNGVYGDVIEEIDWSVGQIVAAVTEAGIAENTLIVFTSDNGPWTMFKEFGGTAKPLRGEKSTTWEGGVRVPFIARWPGKIKPGVGAQFITNTDVYATVAKLTGSTIQDGHAIDSHDMSQVLLAGAKSSRTKHIFFHHGVLAYRSGDYKIHFQTRERTRDPKTGKKEPNAKHMPPLLFNVKTDIAESKNIAADHPQIVERLTKEFNEVQAAMKVWKPF
jgi:arylsulfatase A